MPYMFRSWEVHGSNFQPETTFQKSYYSNKAISHTTPSQLTTGAVDTESLK